MRTRPVHTVMVNGAVVCVTSHTLDHALIKLAHGKDVVTVVTAWEIVWEEKGAQSV